MTPHSPDAADSNDAMPRPTTPLADPDGPRVPADVGDTGDARLGTLDALLRRPEQVVERLGERRVLVKLLALAASGLTIYGLVVGSFAGGPMWWIAPFKVLATALLCGAICFPSLYVFATLAGARVTPGAVVGLVAAAFAWVAIFLSSFAPIAWVFAQSSTLVSFVGALHLLVWIGCAIASRRVLAAAWRHWRARSTALAGVWVVILIVTSLQMTTTLRPFVGRSPELFDGERKFFLGHWAETVHADSRAADAYAE